VTVTEEIAQLLDELELGVYTPSAAGGTVYLAMLPETPDRAVAVALYGSGGPADAGLGYDPVRVQLRFRGDQDVRTAEADAQAAYDALVGLRSRALPGGTWLCLCTPVQAGPIYLGADELRRHEYVINLELLLRRPTAQRD
jgi:hypothetical protein